MRKVLLVLLIVLLIPFYLAAFITIHELGHVALLRLLGDPEAVFYLYKADEISQCLGCTSSDHEGFSWGANLAVSLGGLMGTQLVALTALFLLSLHPQNRLLQRVLSIVALTFAFFDIFAQFPQGLYYNLEQQTYQTSVDLVDFMLLLQMRIDASQVLLKSLLLILAILYLTGFVWLYRRNRKELRAVEPSLVQPPSGVA